jgi:hypothetical protein
VIVPQLAPTDNNQNESGQCVLSRGCADAARRPADAARRRAQDLRHDERSIPRPSLPTLIPGSKQYQATTYAVGTSYQALNWLTFRAGASSGFRAPTATELGANFTTAFTGNITFGNPALSPETSKQVEVGATVAWNAMQLDAALFQNRILDRITSAVRSSTSAVTISDTINNPGEIMLQGIELQAQLDMLRLFHIARGNWRWTTFSNAYYNFNMVDRGAVPAAGTTRATRVYEYEAMAGTRFGEYGTGRAWGDWNLEIRGLLRGPMWYNTEERLLLPGQLVNVHRLRKSPFWVWYTRYEVGVSKGITLFAASTTSSTSTSTPIFIALDQTPLHREIPSFQMAHAAIRCRTRVRRRTARTVVMRVCFRAILATRRALWCRSSPARRRSDHLARRARSRLSRCPRPPQRIVTIFASNTEMVAALGPRRSHRRDRGLYALSTRGGEQAAGRRRLGFSVDARGGIAAPISSSSRRRDRPSINSSIRWSGWECRCWFCCSETCRKSSPTSACWGERPACRTGARPWPAASKLRLAGITRRVQGSQNRRAPL